MEMENATMSGAQESVVDSLTVGPDSPENPIDGGQAGAVAPQEGEGEENPSPQEPDKREQSRQVNAEARIARLQAQMAGKRAADAAIAKLGLRDPDTGEEMTTLEGLQRVALTAQARREGIPPETLLRMQELEEQNNQLQAQLQEVKSQQYEERRMEHLAAIKKAFPDVKAESVQDLGLDFIQAMAIADGKVDPVTVYGIVDARRKAFEKPMPPAMGPLKGAAKPGGGEFFTSEELDALTPEDLKNDAIYEKAMRSYDKVRNKR